MSKTVDNSSLMHNPAMLVHNPEAEDRKLKGWGVLLSQKLVFDNLRLMIYYSIYE